jgi:hypothetical protein
MLVKQISNNQSEYNQQNLQGIVKKVNRNDPNFPELATSYNIMLQNGSVIYEVPNSAGISFQVGDGVVLNRNNRIEFEIMQQSHNKLSIQDIQDSPDYMQADTGCTLDNGYVLR